MYEDARYRYVMFNGIPVQEHRVIWVQHHGPIPPGYEIHHKNGDGKDNKIENLMCLTKSEHRTIHARAKMEGRDIVGSDNPAIIADRKRKNELAKLHRKNYLEEERARDRAEYAKNKPHKQELNREFYQRHRERIRSDQAQYEREHKAERAKRNAKFYAEHTEERKAYNKSYKQEHSAELYAKQRVYRLEHQEEIKAYRHARKDVHAASEVLRRAIRKGIPEEQLVPLRQRLEHAKAEFQKKKGEIK